MSIESDINFLFTGSDKGELSIYEYNDNDTKKKFSLNKKLEIETGMKITCIKYKQSKHELISSFTNGSVGFWTHYEDDPEFILDCHEKKVTKIQYEESTKLLITSSTDKTLKVILTFIYLN
jgi:WD40 repeat protein